jgi:ABC-type enterochelin transport system permease subunit
LESKPQEFQELFVVVVVVVFIGVDVGEIKAAFLAFRQQSVQRFNRWSKSQIDLVFHTSFLSK